MSICQDTDYSKYDPLGWSNYTIRKLHFVEWVYMCDTCYTIHNSLKYTPEIWDYEYGDATIDQIRETINQIREKNEQAEIEQEHESETYEYAYGGDWPNVDLDDIKWGNGVI